MGTMSSFTKCTNQFERLDKVFTFIFPRFLCSAFCTFTWHLGGSYNETLSLKQNGKVQKVIFTCKLRIKSWEGKNNLQKGKFCLGDDVLPVQTQSELYALMRM